MRNSEPVLVLTDKRRSKQEFWERLGALVSGVDLVTPEMVADGNLAKLAHGRIVLADLAGDESGKEYTPLFDDLRKAQSETSAILCLTGARLEFGDAFLPDAILTWPCPVEVIAGTINQIRRLLTRERELDLRLRTLDAVGVSVSGNVSGSGNASSENEIGPSVLALDVSRHSSLFESACGEDIKLVSASTIAAARKYMKWHRFELALIALDQGSSEVDLHDTQTQIKNIPHIVYMDDPDAGRQLSFYDQGALDVLAGPMDDRALRCRILTLIRYNSRIKRSKSGLAETQDVLAALSTEQKRSFADTYRTIQLEENDSSSAQKSFYLVAYEPTIAAMTKDLPDNAIDSIKSVLAMALRDEDLSLFMGPDHVLTILAGADNSGATAALRRISAILKSTDLPAMQDGQKIRVNLCGRNF